MTLQKRDTLRKAAIAVRLHDADTSTSPSTSLSNRWMLQTSNSFRRIGTQCGDGDVLCGTKQRDGQPDLLAAPGVLDYIVAAQPHVVTSLLDDLDAAYAIVEKKIVVIETRLDNIRGALGAAVEKLSTADEVTLAEVRSVFEAFLAAFTEVQ